MRPQILSLLTIFACIQPAIAASPTTTDTGLLSKVGTYDYKAILANPRVLSALHSALSSSAIALIHQNLEVIQPIGFSDGYLVLDGIEAHEGGMEGCTLLINTQNFDVIALFRHNGRRTLYSKATHYGYLPKVIRAFMALPEMDFARETPPRDIDWVDRP